VNFKEIRLIRILVLILLYMIFLFILIFGLVIPVIKSYKNESRNFYLTQNIYEEIKSKHETIYDKLKLLQYKHKKVLEIFEKEWDEKAFLDIANRFFLKTKLKLIDQNSSEKYFKVYELDATTQMTSPENFYRFMESLSIMPFAIEADFPLIFSSDGDLISGVFRIKIFYEKKDQKSLNKENNSSNTTNK